MANEPKRVCVIVVVLNRLNLLESCLSSLKTALSPADTALIIDNQSNDRDKLQAIADRFSDFNWVFNDLNIGFTGGNHQGLAWARQHNFEYAFLLNPDTEVPVGVLDTLVTASKLKADQWIVGPLLVKPGDSSDPIVDSAGLTIDRFYRAQDQYQGQRLSRIQFPEKITSVDGLCGAAMLIPIALLPVRDGMNLLFIDSFFAYFEDVELSWYWRKKGNSFGLCSDTVVVHDRGEGSRLRNISLKDWQKHKPVIEKMIINRYITIALHETRIDLMKRLPLFLVYESIRWLFILVRKPFLLPLLVSSWKLVFKKLVLNQSPFP